MAAIGPTTAEALVNAGIQVDASANKPNSESLLLLAGQARKTSTASVPAFNIIILFPFIKICERTLCAVLVTSILNNYFVL